MGLRQEQETADENSKGITSIFRHVLYVHKNKSLGYLKIELGIIDLS